MAKPEYMSFLGPPSLGMAQATAKVAVIGKSGDPRKVVREANEMNYIVLAVERGGVEPIARIQFQDGTIPDVGNNGVLIEDLLTICADRLEQYQAGKFPCDENARALKNIQEALGWLNKRTADRKKRGVEGKEQV